MKNQTDTAGSPSRSAEGRVDWDAVIRAKREASDLRKIFDALSPIERMLAAKQIEAVRRLVETVEAL
ncbi:hypothetical protein [Burkholderia stagnalis]|uniref:hypothetical protein n=1 Tax=Burkholderia stagnalis TaxID=1503054 RepID=UPI000F5EF21C|nr:hypothetical protein [Burkholderia stagnalis]